MKKGESPSFLNQAKSSESNTSGQKMKKDRKYYRKQHLSISSKKSKAMQTNAISKTSFEKQVLVDCFIPIVLVELFDSPNHLC